MTEIDVFDGRDRRRARRIDRADQIRPDPEAISALMGDRALVLRMDGCDPVIVGEALQWVGLDDVPADSEFLFLGLDGDRGCFAVVPRGIDAAKLGARYDPAAALLTPDDYATLAVARSMVIWHLTHRHCGRCGAMTVPERAGWQRICTSQDCGVSHFPRTDPVVIMTVEHVTDSGERLLLLGSGKGWGANLFSALAGFVEPGETIEQAVAREVMEEVGVKVHSVRYRSAQPWPYPSQLMLGCHALADHTPLVVDRTELADARWFTRAQVFAAIEGLPGAGFVPPPPHAIAHRLLRDWLDSPVSAG